MTQSITQSELESYLWGAAVLLRGFIDAGDYKQFIFPLMFFKRLCDVYDEERARAVAEVGDDFPEYHRFQIPVGAHWRDVRGATQNVGLAIQTAMRQIEKANPLLDGIFGDAPWTNKNRLSDATLTDLLEHFSTQTLSQARVNEDLLGQAYEYLIKKFADDSGHTAAEFYTNRTAVHLMTRLLEPQAGESIYDPTCGSGGMLLSAADELKRRGQDTRTLRMVGQEINLMTSAIARMNLFLHGFEDFQVVRGDTLANPYFKQGDRLQQFDVILANPPYSISSWNRAAWENDPRNIYGTPPQSRADYAFWQHILVSLKEETGRCAILYPHGVLFRNEEKHMRRPLIEADVIDAIIGLGPNLFYNSPMEACVVVCRKNKPAARRGKILFINAINEVTRERAFSFLQDDHIERIAAVYQDFADIEGFTRVVTVAEVLAQDANLSIPLYVRPTNGNNNGVDKPLPLVIAEWQQSSQDLRHSMDKLFETLELSMPQLDMPELPPGFVIGQMGHIATQAHKLAKAYEIPKLQLNETLHQFTSQMPDLMFVTTPMQKALESLNASLPRLHESIFDDVQLSAIAHIMASVPNIGSLVQSGLNDDNEPFQIISSVLEMAETASTNSLIRDALMAVPKFDVEALGILDSQMLSMQHILNGITETGNLFASDAFTSVQTSLGVMFNHDNYFQGFLQSLTLDHGTELREILGETSEVEITIDVLTGTSEIADLPESIRSNVEQIRDMVYRSGIATTVLMIWAINLLWLVRDRDFEPASGLTQMLLALLIYLRELERTRGKE